MYWTRGDHNAAGAPHWCDSRKLPVKSNSEAVEIHTRLTVNSVLKVFLNKIHSQVTEINLLCLEKFILLMHGPCVSCLLKWVQLAITVTDAR